MRQIFPTGVGRNQKPNYQLDRKTIPDAVAGRVNKAMVRHVNLKVNNPVYVYSLFLLLPSGQKKIISLKGKQ